MIRTKLFRSKGLQTIRLPAEVAFPAGVEDVVVIRDGARRIVVPANARWDDFFADPGADIGERAEPGHPVRESF
jgi:antitoxin VapB